MNITQERPLAAGELVDKRDELSEEPAQLPSSEAPSCPSRWPWHNGRADKSKRCTTAKSLRCGSRIEKNREFCEEVRRESRELPGQFVARRGRPRIPEDRMASNRR